MQPLENIVERDDVYQPKQIAEELIKEIMDSSFISSETKKNYCETLAHLVTKEKTTDAILSLRVERTSIESEYRQKQTERMSAMLGGYGCNGDYGSCVIDSVRQTHVVVTNQRADKHYPANCNSFSVSITGNNCNAHKRKTKKVTRRA
ncbi:hypothetical protein K7J50_003603 [Vibrio cholerae]|nr:hypothetical protein [Vibrio cholerae]